MSFGGSQGQVRYALIVDDQASAKIGTFKNQLNTLATGTTNVTRNMGALNSSFTGVQGGLTKTNTLFGQTITTQKTLGQQLGGLGSAFKNNALAIGAAASSVLGLYQNYANLSSAQNNANKSATAAKAAQNNLTKAQDGLNKAIDKYGAGSKEAKAAQDKLTVAQERAVNKTESAKIAQDNLNQTMADFGINILPNVILAGGSITSIFSDISKSGSGLGGIFSKLGGAVSGLGSSFGLAGGGVSGLVGKFKGLGGAVGGLGGSIGGLGGSVGGLGGIFDKLQTSITGSTGSIKSMTGTFGVLALAVGGAVAVFDEINAVMKDHKAVADGSLRPTQALTNELDRMSKVDFSTIEGAVATIAKFTGPGPGLANLLKPFAKDADLAAQGLDKLSLSLKTVPPSMNGAATSTNAMVNRLVVLETKFKAGRISSTEYAKGIFDVQQKLGTAGFGKAQDEANKLIGTYTQTVKQAVPSTNDLSTTTGVLTGKIKVLTSVFQGAGAGGIAGFRKEFEAFSATAQHLPNVLTPDIALFEKLRTQGNLTATDLNKTSGVIKGFGNNIDALKAKFLALNAAQPKIIGAFHLSPDMVKYDQLLKDWGGGVLNKVTTEQQAFNNATKLGVTNFKELQTTTKANVATASSYRAELVKWATTQGGVTNATKLTTGELETLFKASQKDVGAMETLAAAHKKLIDEFNTNLASAQTNIKGIFKIDSNADKILKDLIKGLPNKAEKEIKLQLKFQQSAEDNKKAFNDLMFEATQVSDSTADAAAKQIISQIDKKFKGAKGQFAGLRASLQTAIADPNTPEALKKILMSADFSAAGNKIGADVNKGIQDFFGHGAGLDFGEGGGAGIVVPVAAPVIPAPITTAFDTGISTIKTNIASIANVPPPVVKINISTATKSISQLIGNFGGWFSVASKANPIAKLNITGVVKSISRMIGDFGGWFSTVQKANPAAKINITGAVKSISRLISDFGGYVSAVNKANPTVKINISNAIKSIDRLIGDLNGIPNITRTVTIKTNQVGAQHGLHTTLDQDTVIQAHKGERVDIGPGRGGTSNNASFGGGNNSGGEGGPSGDIIINLATTIFDERILRSLRRKLGSNRYVFGT